MYDCFQTYYSIILTRHIQFVILKRFVVTDADAAVVVAVVIDCAVQFFLSSINIKANESIAIFTLNQ